MTTLPRPSPQLAGGGKATTRAENHDSSMRAAALLALVRGLETPARFVCGNADGAREEDTGDRAAERRRFSG